MGERLTSEDRREDSMVNTWEGEGSKQFFPNFFIRNLFLQIFFIIFFQSVSNIFWNFFTKK